MKVKLIVLLIFISILEMVSQKKECVFEPNQTILNGNFQSDFDNWVLDNKNYFFISDEFPNKLKGKRIKYQKNDSLKTTASGFYQTVNFKKDTYYKLQFSYKGDGNLTPVILIEENFNKKLVRRLFRLKKTDTWEKFDTEFMMKNKGGSQYKIYFFPAGFPFRKKDRGIDRPNDFEKETRDGSIYFTDIKLVKTDKQIPPTPRGPYSFKTDTIVYKKTDSIHLKLYVDLPQNSNGLLPVYIQIHGGGWVNGSPTDLLSESKFLAERGVACVRIQYRLVKQGGSFEKTMSDIMAAIDWVRNNKEKYNFDLSRLALSGGSAGGHLSSIAAQHTPECKTYVGYWGLYNAYERGLGRFGKAKFIGKTIEEKKNASAIYQLKVPPPNSLLFHGKADPTIDYLQTIRFAEAIELKGGEVKTVILEGVGHGVTSYELIHKNLIPFLNKEWNMNMKYD